MYPPSDHLIAESRWIYQNKLDDAGLIIRNKAGFVGRGLTQIEGLDYDETFAPGSHLEAIHIFLTYPTHEAFKVYQMDVKSVFLNSELNEDVYIQQPLGL